MPSKLEKAAAKLNEGSLKRQTTVNLSQPKVNFGQPKQEIAKRYEQVDNVPTVVEEIEKDSFDTDSPSSVTKGQDAPAIRDVKAWNEMNSKDGIIEDLLNDTDTKDEQNNMMKMIDEEQSQIKSFDLKDQNHNHSLTIDSQDSWLKQVQTKDN